MQVGGDLPYSGGPGFSDPNRGRDTGDFTGRSFIETAQVICSLCGTIILRQGGVAVRSVEFTRLERVTLLACVDL